MHKDIKLQMFPIVNFFAIMHAMKCNSDNKKTKIYHL